MDNPGNITRRGLTWGFGAAVAACALGATSINAADAAAPLPAAPATPHSASTAPGAPLLDPDAPPPPPDRAKPDVAQPAESYDEAMRRVLAAEHLTRVEVEIQTFVVKEGNPDPCNALVAKYGADRVVQLSHRMAFGAAAPSEERLSVLAKDRRGHLVLLRTQARQQVVYRPVHDCQGVQGIRATMTTYYTAAVLPKGQKVTRTIDVPFLEVVEVQTRPPECNNIP